MLFVSIKLVFSLLLGICRFNHAHAQIIHNITLPIITERNCTHVTFSNDIQFDPQARVQVIAVRIYNTENKSVYTAEVGYHTNDEFFLERQKNMFYNYTTLRVDPIPKSKGDRFTLHVTFRFPDERLIYKLSYNGHTPGLEKLISPLITGKSRCLPQDDITGCDPYCVCDTVVQKKCQDGRSIRGKCSYSGSTTDNSGRYTFNEACDLSSKPSSSGSFSSKPSSTKKVIESQFSKSTIGLVAGIIIVVVGAIAALTFYRKKKKGYIEEAVLLSDESASN